jgi:hypothetical protein
VRAALAHDLAVPIFGPELNNSSVRVLACDLCVSVPRRTFIVGDDVVQASESLQKRIVDSETTEYAHSLARGSEIGGSPSFILDGIESLVLSVDPATAFGLLVKAFEADAVAMENCGDRHFDVEHVFRRAAELMTAACKAVPEHEALAKISALLAVDCYGVRQGLAHVISNRGDV